MTWRLARREIKRPPRCEAAGKLYPFPETTRAPAGRVDGSRQSGIVTVLPENVIWFAAAGALEIGGTLKVVTAGADPGVPPRGTVRTTCAGGSGVFAVRFAHTLSIALMK